MAKPPLFSPEYLRNILSYDPASGEFRWKDRPNIRPSLNARMKGQVTRAIDKSTGYQRINIDWRLFYAHHIAWFYVYGIWPKAQIDHRDGVRSNNKIENLREATHAENHQNRSVNINNTSGHPGVGWYKAQKKWSASVMLSGKSYHAGYFDKIEDAILAREALKAELHPFQPTLRMDALE